ncbi:ArnT family glycosyltransferase [Azohydromonas aeria]|uniref:ArnT family glycosyltransferase n=1 Tax=Azohydromonas aeria TaxID=2590212 RepID=UPI0012FB9122|nr:phospholipid carrier-dependent glycosyltransferase [Azohydromonas aeria]
MKESHEMDMPVEPGSIEFPKITQTGWSKAGKFRSLLAWTGLVLVTALAFLFSDLSRFPVLMWDESRLAVNALEMALNGPSLVTTFGFEPDLWNTKPPLQIWLMALSISHASQPEVGLRLPSALAALATVALIFYFTYRFTRSPVTAAAAALLLLSSRGFYGTHVARTGDYDALLVLLATAYCGLLFRLLHGSKSRAFVFEATGLCLALAVMTKGVGGLMPVAGVVVHAMLTRRWHRLWVWPSSLKAALIFSVLLTSFYVFRELSSPGYLEAVLRNEFGRYVADLDPQSEATRQGFMYLFQVVTVHRHFALGILLVFVLPIGWYLATPRRRLLLSYALVVSFTFLLVVSSSRTRYYWYIAPVYPWLAVAAAVSIESIIKWLKHNLHRRWQALGRAAPALLALLLAGVFGLAVADRHVRLVNYRDGYESAYGPFLKDLVYAGHDRITVVDGGRADAGPVMNAHYNPVLRFYQMYIGWRTGASVQIVHALPASLSTGDVLATCDARFSLSPSQAFEVIAHTGRCNAVAVK